MDSFKLISILSKSLSDMSIITQLGELKDTLASIEDEDLAPLYEKYPKLKQLITDLLAKLS